jgi:hypothetical protein
MGQLLHAVLVSFVGWQLLSTFQPGAWSAAGAEQLP